MRAPNGAARGQNPSLLVQEGLARWLAEEAQAQRRVTLAFRTWFERRQQ